MGLLVKFARKWLRLCFRVQRACSRQGPWLAENWGRCRCTTPSPPVLLRRFDQGVDLGAWKKGPACLFPCTFSPWSGGLRRQNGALSVLIFRNCVWRAYHLSSRFRAGFPKIAGPGPALSQLIETCSVRPAGCEGGGPGMTVKWALSDGESLRGRPGP